MFLTNEVFKIVIQNTPLVAIDFIAENQDNRILLGKRTNPPAKGFWFTPGGRILKNELLQDAFERLLYNELHLTPNECEQQFLGVYEHLYHDSIFGDEISTHYVVLAYRLKVPASFTPPKDQHSEYNWFSADEIVHGGFAHENVVRYFT